VTQIAFNSLNALGALSPCQSNAGGRGSPPWSNEGGPFSTLDLSLRVSYLRRARGRRSAQHFSRARAGAEPPALAPAGARLLNRFRLREWAAAIAAAAIARPARIHDLRSTFASDALAAGVGIHALAGIMGTSVRMIERHCGRLLDGALESIAGRLDALDRVRNEDAQSERR
jgi:integrase